MIILERFPPMLCAVKSMAGIGTNSKVPTPARFAFFFDGVSLDMNSGRGFHPQNVRATPEGRIRRKNFDPPET